MQWWAWILFGLALLAAEMLTPGGFFVLFFGLAALIVGGLVAIGATGPVWTEWLLFSVIAVVSLIVFRKRLVDALKMPASGGARLDSVVGDVVVLLDVLARDHGIGRVLREQVEPLLEAVAVDAVGVLVEQVARRFPHGRGVHRTAPSGSMPISSA